MLFPKRWQSPHPKSIHMSAENLNSAVHICAAGTLFTEPAPKLSATTTITQLNKNKDLLKKKKTKPMGSRAQAHRTSLLMAVEMSLWFLTEAEVAVMPATQSYSAKKSWITD